jgi:carboxypeptidase family protein
MARHTLPMTPRTCLFTTLALAGFLLIACNSGGPPATPTTVASAVPCNKADPHAAGLFAVVLDPDGTPISGAVVEIHRAEFTGNATTSADGRFQAACTSGHFSITVSAIGHNPASKEIDVALGQRVDATFTLPRVPTASG